MSSHVKMIRIEKKKRPFIPFQSDRLWEMLGYSEDIDTVNWLDSFEISFNKEQFMFAFQLISSFN